MYDIDDYILILRTRQFEYFVRKIHGLFWFIIAETLFITSRKWKFEIEINREHKKMAKTKRKFYWEISSSNLRNRFSSHSIRSGRSVQQLKINWNKLEWASSEIHTFFLDDMRITYVYYRSTYDHWNIFQQPRADVHCVDRRFMDLLSRNTDWFISESLKLVFVKMLRHCSNEFASHARRMRELDSWERESMRFLFRHSFTAYLCARKERYAAEIFIYDLINVLRRYYHKSVRHHFGFRNRNDKQVLKKDRTNWKALNDRWANTAVFAFGAHL